MLTSELNADNVIGVTEADLREEQKQAMEEYKQLCLKSFSLNRSGKSSRSKICRCLSRLPLILILVNYKRWLILQLIML